MCLLKSPKINAPGSPPEVLKQSAPASARSANSALTIAAGTDRYQTKGNASVSPPTGIKLNI